jgi:hypothetical protein
MPTSRLDAFRAMVAENPANALARFGLANDAAKEDLLIDASRRFGHRGMAEGRAGF